ncbi:MAG: hypothetical protein JWQ14_3043, partial [Adhaeribacter sp.]|nr:hypothetical protein [Adhaeribacter sp.]
PYPSSMNIREELLQAYSKAQVLSMAAFIGQDAGRFADLMKLLLGTEYRVTQRAAWVLSHCADQHPALLTPFLPALIANLGQTNLPAVKRNTLRVLQYVTIPEPLQGELANCCFALLAAAEPVAIKVFAMTVLANLTQQEPDLKNELHLVLEVQLPHASPAFIARARRLMPELALFRNAGY